MFGEFAGVSFDEQVVLAVVRRDDRECARKKCCRHPGCGQQKVWGRGAHYCVEHRALHRSMTQRMKGDRAAQQRRKRARRKVLGLCQMCGRHPAERPTTLCRRCRVAANEAGKRAYARRKIAA